MSCGHKSHIGQKNCFTPKYHREKCTYVVLTEQTLYNEHLKHIKVYIFESSQSKDSSCTVPKPNNTGCANYTGWNIKIIMYFVNLNTLTCGLIITMENKQRHHFWKNTIGACQMRTKFFALLLGAKIQGDRKSGQIRLFKVWFWSNVY